MTDEFVPDGAFDAHLLEHDERVEEEEVTDDQLIAMAARARRGWPLRPEVASVLIAEVQRSRMALEHSHQAFIRLASEVGFGDE